jgi:hypothetical protein
MIHGSHRRMKVVSGFFGIDEWPIVIIRVLSPPLSTALTILSVLDLSPGSNSWAPSVLQVLLYFMQILVPLQYLGLHYDSSKTVKPKWTEWLGNTRVLLTSETNCAVSKGHTQWHITVVKDF